MTKHADTTQKHLHVASQTVADAAARTALEATLVTGQISMQVYQEDTNVLYVCIAAATLADLGTLITLDDHLHAGVAGDGGQLEADNALLATGDADGLLPYAQGDNSVAWETPRDHLHAGVAGDGGQIEADLTLLATGDADTKVLTPDGANAVQWSDVPAHDPADHLHAGVAGDGNQLEAVNTLLATGDTAHHMLVAKGDNAVEIVDPAVTYYSWFDITFAAEGTVEVASGALRYYAPCALTIDKVYISTNTAPTGASLIVDIHKDGVTIFTAQGKRPEIAIAGFSDESDTPDIQVLAKNSYLQCDIDQVGSTIAGADLTVHVRCMNFLQID